MPKALHITSTANPLLKNVRKAVARGGLTDEGYCVAEGFHLLSEAVRSSAEIGYVLVAESSHARLPELPGGSLLALLPDNLFASIAGTESSQGVVTLVRLPAWTECDLLRGNALVVILDGVQDPGNAGAIARAAEAFGATGVVFGKGSARIENPKTLRASAGSLFRIPRIAASDWAPRGVRVFAAMPFGSGAQAADRADLTQPCAIVIGSEGQGVSGTYRRADHIAIPTTSVESLNAAMAASILLYEARRQRSGRKA